MIRHRYLVLQRAFAAIVFDNLKRDRSSISRTVLVEEGLCVLALLALVESEIWSGDRHVFIFRTQTNQCSFLTSESFPVSWRAVASTSLEIDRMRPGRSIV